MLSVRTRLSRLGSPLRLLVMAVMAATARLTLSPISRVTIPAMAAKMTERLWEIGDIVHVLETWEMAAQRKAA